MEHSEKINEIAVALCQFQGENKDVYKDKKGYGYNYADLTQVLELVRPLASKYGLSFVQFPSSTGDRVGVTTQIMHEKSGQWIRGTLELPVTVGKGLSYAQAAGSVISYARRYSLTSILGIAQSDNDASVQSTVVHEMASEGEIKEILRLSGNDPKRLEGMCKYYDVSSLEQLSMENAVDAINNLKKSNASRIGDSSKSDRMSEKIAAQIA